MLINSLCVDDAVYKFNFLFFCLLDLQVCLYEG